MRVFARFLSPILISLAVAGILAGVASVMSPETLIAHSVRRDPLAPMARFILFPSSRKRANYENSRGQTLLQIVLGLLNDSRTDKPKAWELAQLFIKAGVNPNHCDHQGYSALHSAVVDLNEQEIEFLIFNKANINVRCVEGLNKNISQMTPFALAHSMAMTMPGHYDSIIAFLAAHGGLE
jgi:hypothetical protein